MMERLLSAVAPTGTLHIGNYVGTIRNWLELQHRYESFFCVADLHALTAPWRPLDLENGSLDVARVYLASGIDPAVSTIFLQSQVPQHAELCWILAAFTKVPQLQRMTQYKDKTRGEKEKGNLALLSYPVLMAADILLYRANVVPVGEDQTQHLELVRLLAARFNTVLGETFPIPSALIERQGARIMGLDDPGRKMSKTAPPHNHIALTDTPDAIREKIRKAVTDPGKEIALRPDKPAISNLLTIYSLFAMKAVSEIEEMYGGKSYLAFKNDLADLIVDALCPFQEALASIGEERAREVLAEGADKARKIATETIRDVKEKVGLLMPD